MSKVLLTGFEPFDGETINPSIETARAVSRHGLSSASIDLLALPVDRFKAVALTLERIATAPPAVLIMLGEAGNRYRINPERVAVNIDDYRIPDNAGNKPIDEPIVGDGPVAYLSGLPIRAITERLLEANIPARISNSAGTYLCNRLFYSVMHEIATRRLPTRAGFVHLPYLHQQVLENKFDFPSLSLDTMVEAVKLAIEVCVAATNAGEDS